MTPTPSANPTAARQARVPAWGVGALLVAMVFVAYMRVWHAGFIWDDDDHLTRNPCIVGPLGFGAIWTSSKAVYYPLVLTSFWVQHAIWGLNPLPYHLVDVALHAACGVLLWRVLRALGVPGAWLGAAIWALHPVQVESAAWITEQKNTQSGLFYLVAILLFVRWVKEKGAGSYATALVCATLAILSKSSTVMLPVVLGLCWWWLDGRWRWQNVPWLAPFAAVSAVASAWTIWEQKYGHHALGAAWSQTWPERAAIAGKDAWFYLWKLAWPHPLTFIYPRWNVNATHAAAFLPLMALVFVMALLWLLRDGKARPVFFAAAYFVVSLVPVLGFFNVYFFRYSFVGDHFQYLASMGPLALAGAGIARAAELVGGEKSVAFRALSGALLLVLGGMTWLQTGVYFNLETLWRATLADNPAAWIAHFNLADVLVRQGHLDEAVGHYREVLCLVPASEEARGNLANVLLMQGRTNAAEAELRELLSEHPGSVNGHGDLAAVLLREGRVADAIPEAKRATDLARGASETGKAPNTVAMLRILAVAYAAAGRYPEAITAAKEALQRAVAERNTPLADALRKELALYEARTER